MRSILEIWQSEETMEQAYTDLMSLTKLDRTTDANRLVNKLMGKLLDHPTFYDKRRWVNANVNDFNLASQLLLNCQEGSVTFFTSGLETNVREWEQRYASIDVSPFAKKAKFIEAEDDASKEFNQVLAGVRNLKILASAGVAINSFRISPLGSTPALSDTNNLSQLSVAGLRRYMDPAASIWLLNHAAIAKAIDLRQQDDGGYVAYGLDYPIYSKSGGDIVTRSITSRWVAHQILSQAQALYVVPKYDSLLVVGGEAVLTKYKEFVDEFKG